MTSKIRASFLTAAVGAVLFSGAAFAGHHSEQKNIVETAAANPDFSTLVAAVQAAGLVETLSGEGPFTVFAPTNAAFEKLPAGTVDALLLPENREQLVAVLTYHVVAAEVSSEQVVTLESATTVNGQDVVVSFDGEQVSINDATVIAADIKASNGVIHVIDTVILPQ
jgi:uncharacterized surface protein with fasciclin (FAS1) repeats